MTQQNISSSTSKEIFSQWYDKYYKILLFIPIILLALSFIQLGISYSTTGNVIEKDISLSGGTSITAHGSLDSTTEARLMNEFDNINLRKLTDIRSGEATSFIIETSSTPEEIKPKLEQVIGYKLDETNANIEFTGSTLSNNFYRQLITALVASFILMSLVVFLLFRSFVPSLAVIFAAFADLVMTLALVNIIGLKLSAAGIAAFLMLVGYSVDTDILLTSRALKRKDIPLNSRIVSAFKTGILMTLTALISVLPIFFITTGIPDSFRQIFIILSIGLSADILNTWLTNASLIKWYCEKKQI